MTSEPRSISAPRSIEETLALLEARTRAQQDAGEALRSDLALLRHQVQTLAEEAAETKQAANQSESTLGRYHGLPLKVAELSTESEQLRTMIVETRAALATAERTRDTELLTTSRELREALRGLETLEGRLNLLASTGATHETQLQQLTHALGQFADWQRELGERSDQFDLHLRRLTEASDKTEGKVVAAVESMQKQHLEVLHDRLQILGEMAHRAEERIEELRLEQHVAANLKEEMGRRRDEYERIETRVSSAEAAVEALAPEIENVRGQTTLLDGRHSGLSERVSLIRRDIAEVIDHVREEFARFGEMQEKSRRKQIETLEQELRELKFHGLRPPGEP